MEVHESADWVCVSLNDRKAPAHARLEEALLGIKSPTTGKIENLVFLSKHQNLIIAKDQGS